MLEIFIASVNMIPPKHMFNFSRNAQEDRWHQKIAVTFKPEGFVFSDLAKILTRLGYSTDAGGEVFFYARQDHVEQWQTDVLVTVNVFFDDKDLDYYGDEVQEINKVELGYLLPWQPAENANDFISKVWALSGELDTPACLNDKAIEKADLLALVNECAKDLEKRLEPPGGEFLAQAIEQDLPI